MSTFDRDDAPKGALVTHSYYIDSTDLLTASRSGTLISIGTWSGDQLVEFEFPVEIALVIRETLGDFCGEADR